MEKRLQVHVAAPLQAETSLERLAAAALTPLQDLYVRNNVDGAGVGTTLQGAEPAWSLELVNSSERVTVSLDALLALPQLEVEMVLQCSGNGRAEFHAMAPVAGAVWQHGALAQVRFRGVPLKALLEPYARHDAPFLTAQGRGSQEPHEPAFERSVPLDDVLDSALLAVELNGQPLPGLHGGPLRLIVPGYYGVNNIKWVERLELTKEPSPNHYQLERYRLPLTPLEPGSAFVPTLENSRSSWRQNVKSLIFSPLQDAMLEDAGLKDGTPGRCVTVTGVAWNDGRSLISEVEVSADQGVTWQRAELFKPESPFGWTRFETEVTLQPGRHDLWSRATDASGQSQPLDARPFWNPDGYEWNGVHKVCVTVI